jgi:ParB family chromosome partitioning protein
MSTQIRDISLERICPNLRCIYALEPIEELAREIALEGQREPIQVWFAGDEFRIVDGEKRWRACRSLGMATIKAVITEVEAAGV